jgi:hypothetical protein
LLLILILGNDIKAQPAMFDSKFGLGGGYTPVWIFPNLKPINDKLGAFGTGEFNSSGFYANGGAGYIYISVVENIRIGGLGFGGSSTLSGSKDGFDKKIEYSFSLGGFSIEYTLPFIKGLGVSVGTIIGGGSREIELYQNQGSYSWDGIWEEVSDTSQSTKNIYRKISNGFFTLTPTINVDVPLSRFLSFRLGGGYIFSFNSDWEWDNGRPVSGMPSGLNDGTFYIQSGLFLGFFSF